MLSLLKYTFTFCLLWMVTNYVYIRALGVLQAADVIALFSSSNAFVYIFSVILLKEKFYVIRVSSLFYQGCSHALSVTMESYDLESLKEGI